MKIYNIVFSPTGGTLKVANAFATAISSDITKIDLSNPKTDFSTFSFSSDDVCIIAIPSYGGRVPAVAISRLKQLKANQTKAILICVYGNRDYDDTFLELKENLITMNFHCIAGIAAIAEHSIMHTFATSRPDEKDFEELKTFATKIMEKINTNTIKGDLKLPGKSPYREYNGSPIKPITNKKCTECGSCSARCPIEAIPIETPNKTDDTKCISCMRCIKICPNNARTVNQIILALGTQKMKKSCKPYKHNELFI